MATSTGMTRLESFPFTSHDDGYDADGYPVFDRAVGSGMLRDTFEKFFTNGIFPNPGTALQIGKASSGLAVTIQPGIGIIKGAMGGIRGDQPITVTLDTQAPQGNTAYGIMLRFDNTDGFADSRSLLINVVRGDASSSPTPPAPDTTTPEVYELRLGYVVVPSGATDLSNATVTNEKGLNVCPYAAPFEEIDVSGIVADFKTSADESLSKLLEYYEANKGAIDAALDDSEATYLQQQISALQEQMENFDLGGSVDDETIEYSTASGEVEPKLRVKDSAITTDKLALYSVTVDNLAEDVIGLITNPKPGQDVSAYSWQELKWLAANKASEINYMIGQTKNVNVTGYGSVPFTLIGINHDDLSSGSGKAGMTFISTKALGSVAYQSSTSQVNPAAYPTSTLKQTIESTTYNAFEEEVREAMVSVSKVCDSSTISCTVWPISLYELTGLGHIDGYPDGTFPAQEGALYEYFSENPTAQVRNPTGVDYWTRTARLASKQTNQQNAAFVLSSGTTFEKRAIILNGIVPCFCI